MMSANTHKLLYLQLQNLIRQIRLPWSSYAAIGATFGVLLSYSPQPTANPIAIINWWLLGLGTHGAYWLFKRTLPINLTIFTISALLTASYSAHQISRTRQLYSAYQAGQFTVTGQIIELDGPVPHTLVRQIKLAVAQIFPHPTPKRIQPTIISVRLTGADQLQLHDQMLITNLTLANSLAPKNNFNPLTLPAKTTNRTSYKILARHHPGANSSLIAIPTSAINQLQVKIHQLKHHLLTKLKLKLSPRAFQLLATIFLGYRKTGPHNAAPELHPSFQIWGLAHFLARAGLHMILLTLLIQLALSAQLPVRWQSPALIATVWLYALLSWPSISFIRALNMVILYELCQLSRLQTDGLHLLNLIFTVALIYQPTQLFCLEFQLSFGLTYALILAFRQNQYHKLAPTTATTL